MAQVDYFLKIDGIDSESNDAKHKGEIEVESYSWGETNSVVAGRPGAAVGKVQPQDFSFVKRVDKASPLLFIGCAMGTRYKNAILTARRSGASQQDSFKITMEDVQITAYENSGQASSDAPPHDHVSLNFVKLEMSYRPLRADGTFDAEVKQKYDFGANKKV